ncbi:RRP15-like protein [Diadema antillarum]|uniref:RRP15-like protein n=1 Tax=Diadema antillarum TaxID=105358 RepID=UPI003A885FFE
MRGSDGEDEMSDGEDEDESEVMPGGGGGWADAMASILRKEAPEGSSAVLAKSKDYAKAKEQEHKEFMERLKEKQSKKKWENMARAIPKVTDRERERALQRIATKGVVQLFNAVKKQQKTREEKLKEVGGSQRKQAKVEASLTKGDFLDMLRGTPAPSKTDSNPKSRAGLSSSSQPATKEHPSWGVLRDDFMLGAKMKDWDKDDGSDESDLDDDNDRKSDEENSGFSSDSD